MDFFEKNVTLKNDMVVVFKINDKEAYELKKEIKEVVETSFVFNIEVEICKENNVDQIL